MRKTDYSWNPSTFICENSKQLKNIANDSVIAYDEIIYVMNTVPTNMTNTIPTNITNAMSTNASTNSDSKRVRYEMDCYILHIILLVIILLFIISIICYLYTKHKSKLKNIMPC